MSGTGAAIGKGAGSFIGGLFGPIGGIIGADVGTDTGSAADDPDNWYKYYLSRILNGPDALGGAGGMSALTSQPGGGIVGMTSGLGFGTGLPGGLGNINGPEARGLTSLLQGLLQ
jgi:hypothetical protein